MEATCGQLRNPHSMIERFKQGLIVRCTIYYKGSAFQIPVRGCKKYIILPLVKLCVFTSTRGIIKDPTLTATLLHSAWEPPYLLDQVKHFRVVCRSGINQVSLLFPLNGISCTSVCPQADSCKPNGTELYVVQKR